MGWKPLETTNFCIFCIIEPNDSLNDSLDLTPSNSGIHEGSTTNQNSIAVVGPGGLKGCSYFPRWQLTQGGYAQGPATISMLLGSPVDCTLKGLEIADSWWTQDIVLKSVAFGP